MWPVATRSLGISPGHVGFNSGSTTWEMYSHGKILSSLSLNFLYKNYTILSKLLRKLNKNIFCKGLGIVTEPPWCWQLLNLEERTELELAWVTLLEGELLKDKTSSQ